MTGASGFVGAALLRRLGAPAQALALGAEGWERRIDACRLEGATVFHLAARVHRPGDADEGAFQRDNVEKTRRLAEAAARAGARRFVFLSTLKVHGEESPGRAFRPDDPFDPRDAYARSKRDAEMALAQVAGLPTCVVRAPLVYGAAARGNLQALLRLADSPWPLPFAAVANRRSFVHVDDLAELLAACGTQPGAAGEAFLAAHRESVSTAALLAILRRHLGRPARLFGVAPAWLEAGAAALGQGERMRRLTRSLEADPAHAEAQLGWRAQVGIEAALEELARAWRAREAA